MRGFTGFGTALIFVPVAAAAFSPVQAIAIILIVDVPATLPLAPRALRDGDWREVARLLPGGLAGLSLGLFLLTRLDPVVFRWIICMTALAALASGWRYRGALGPAGAAAVGGAAGVCGGAAGAAGPSVTAFDPARERLYRRVGYAVIAAAAISGLPVW